MESLTWSIPPRLPRLFPVPPTVALTLVSAAGTPVVGAAVTITSIGCPTVDAYNLPITDATGDTYASVPYGSYSYSVTYGGSTVAHTNVTLQVGANSVQLTSGGVTTKSYLPNLLQVRA